MNQFWAVIGEVVFWAAVVACLLFLGRTVGRFLKAIAEVQAKPTPEVAKDYKATETTGEWGIPVLRDIPHPERYPKPWAYRAARAAEETTEIKVERTP